MPSTTANAERSRAVDQIALCYTSRWHQGYARGKLRHDPAFDDAIAWAHRAELSSPVSRLLDLGCGLGLLAHWLRANGLNLPITGLDPDAKKIAAATAAAKAARLADVEFAVGAAQNVDPLPPGSVFMLDVLHYLPLAEREILLERIAASMPPGGIIYIRNGLHEHGWRNALTRAEEWAVRFSGWISTRGFRLPKADEIRRHFPQRNFLSDARPLWGRTPFNSHRFAFQRKP